MDPSYQATLGPLSVFGATTVYSTPRLLRIRRQWEQADEPCRRQVVAKIRDILGEYSIFPDNGEILQGLCLLYAQLDPSDQAALLTKLSSVTYLFNLGVPGAAVAITPANKHPNRSLGS